MKKVLFIVCIVITTFTALAGAKNETQNPIIGTWKFTNQTLVNDFQKVNSKNDEFQTEYFIFEPNHTFSHDFINTTGHSVKILKGKWKFNGDKILIIYSDVDYSMTLGYFYIGKDLILGQNFNHVVFTRESTDFLNVAAK